MKKEKVKEQLNFRRISRRALAVWRIRLCVIMLVPSFLVSLFSPFLNFWWIGLTLFYLLIFLILFCIYYPLKYRKIKYCIDKDILIVLSGVIYTRRNFMYLSAIKYVKVTSSPLMRMFRVKTVQIMAAGGMVKIPFLLSVESDKLLNEIGLPQAR